MKTRPKKYYLHNDHMLLTKENEKKKFNKMLISEVNIHRSKSQNKHETNSNE